MRKIFYTLLFLMIITGYAQGQGGSSCITLNIYCTDDQNFLDKVEAKLLKTINQQNCKINDYAVNPNNGADWLVQLTKSEMIVDTLPKLCIPSYKYQLVINWDSTHNNGYIFGFSREYYYNLRKFSIVSKQYPLPPNVYSKVFHHIPLAEYKNFLSKNEIAKLYKIIQKNFINYINIDTVTLSKWYPTNDPDYYCQIYSDTSCWSKQTLDLGTNDALVLMPLSYWGSVLKKWIVNGLSSYKEPSCLNSLTSYEIKEIFQRIDTVTGEDGRKVPIYTSCPVTSITIAEKWMFDTLINTKPSDWIPYAIKIKREIQAIAIITHCNNLYGPTPDKSAWIPYKDLDLISRQEHFTYYREQLDNALFKKLNLKYEYYRN